MSLFKQRRKKTGRIKSEERGEVVMITISQDILDEGDDLRETVNSIFSGGKTQIAFNLGGIRYVSARVLGIIAESIYRARKVRGEVRVICVDPALNRLLHKMGFDKVIEITTSGEEMMDGFSEGILTPEKAMLWKPEEVYARA